MNFYELNDQREPLSHMLIEINDALESEEYEIFLYELDGLSEMLVNYVKSPAEGITRIKFIQQLVAFIVKHRYLTRGENLYVIQIILLNELYKKNQNEPSVLNLLKREMHFDKNNEAAFKTVIKKELREICMEEHNISDRKEPRYRKIVKPFIRDFEDFYYSFR